MIYKLNEEEMNLFKEIRKITYTDYTEENNHTEIEVEAIMEALKDVVCYYHNLEEVIEDMEREKELTPEDYMD